MCMFCAAVPVAGAVGARLNADQKAARLRAEAEGRELPKEKPIAKMTAGAIVVLGVCSVTYHFVLAPHIRYIF